MKLGEAETAIRNELSRAKALHPEWPEDVIHQVAIMQDESGEAIRAAVQYVYEGGSIEAVKDELKQTGAMVLR
jgi:hypothetical protein